MTQLRFILLLFLFIATTVYGADKKPCYEWLHKIYVKNFQNEFYPQNARLPEYRLKSAESNIPIVRAFEKEGLLYEDISPWFPDLKDGVGEKLIQRLKDEATGAKPKHFTRWLKNHPIQYSSGIDANYNPSFWAKQSPEDILSSLLYTGTKQNKSIDLKRFFALTNKDGKNDIFYDGILDFNDLAVSKDYTPEFLDVTDDIGSYEVKTSQGIDNFRTYLKLRHKVEEFLEGSVGHQHLVHGWPESASTRKEIAPYYIELLDASTWYLYWKQAKRNPLEVSSIIPHPYLGLYTRGSLNRLHRAMVEGDVAGFKDKYRMIGARSLKADPTIEGQGSQGEKVPDFELRSGNKSDDRKNLEALIMSRITTGDYVDQMAGLKAYDSYEFNPSAPLNELLLPLGLKEHQIKTLLEFEQRFRFMEYSPDVRAKNHTRNKIIAPLLPWQNRLPISNAKKETLLTAQKAFAEKMYEIARRYLNRINPATKQATKNEATNEAMASIEYLVYRFAKKMKLHEDFQTYLIPRPNKVAKITVDDPFVDNINLGIEFSFRFPQTITSRDQATKYIEEAVNAYAKKNGGGKIERQADGGHGHGLSVRYIYTDPENKIWRFEWDGIIRTYPHGKAFRPHGGHMEVPTPKFAPQDPKSITNLYSSMRDLGMRPKRTAGGAHVNIDLEPFMSMKDGSGAKEIAKFIHFFESNREMVSFLWQHPSRYRVAIPVDHSTGLGDELAKFTGGWDELADLLYRKQYFNPFVGRKPKYTQLNVTSILEPAIPNEYLGYTVDIKNPNAKWRPEFPQKTGRIEFRLFDAMDDEAKAALQIKYVRALLKYARNNYKMDGKFLDNISSTKKFLEFLKNPALFETAAREHFAMLGLNYEEYHFLVAEAWLTNHNALKYNKENSKGALRKKINKERKNLNEEEEEDSVYMIPWSGKSFSLEEEDSEILRESLEDDVDFVPNSGPMIKHKFLPSKLEKKNKSGMLPSSKSFLWGTNFDTTFKQYPNYCFTFSNRNVLTNFSSANT